MPRKRLSLFVILLLSLQTAAVRADNVDDYAILKQTTREQMWTPVKLNSGATHPYGFGWFLEPLGAHRRVNHGGTISGFRSHFLRLPDDKLSIIVLTNCDDANPAVIVRGVAATYFPDLAAPAAK